MLKASNLSQKFKLQGNFLWNGVIVGTSVFKKVSQRGILKA
jgi:hypothetical protein